MLTPFASGCHLRGRILWHLRCCWWKRDLLYCVSLEGKRWLWLRRSDWNCNVGNILEPPSDFGHVDPDADLSLWQHRHVVCVFCLWCWGWNLGPYIIRQCPPAEWQSCILHPYHSAFQTLLWRPACLQDYAYFLVQRPWSLSSLASSESKLLLLMIELLALKTFAHWAVVAQRL